MIFEIDELLRKGNKQPRLISYELMDELDKFLKLEEKNKYELIDLRNDLVKGYMGAVECLRGTYFNELDKSVSYAAMDKILDDMSAVTSVIDRRLMNLK